MSKVRPGTVHYSKWDQLSDSDDEDKGLAGASPSSLSAAPAAGGMHFKTQHDLEEERRAIRARDEMEQQMEASRRAERQQRSSTATDRGGGVRGGASFSGPPGGERRGGGTRKRCDYCGRPNAPKRCARCSGPSYCDSSCQRAAWPAHLVRCFEEGENAWWGIFTQASVDRKARAEETREARVEVRRVAAERRRAAKAAAKAAEAQRGAGKGGKGKGGDEEREETCAICMCEFTVSGDSGTGISCPASHFMCSECTSVYVETVMENLDATHPPKCSMCRAVIPQETFEMQLNADQARIYEVFMAERSLGEGEIVLQCNDCGYYEIRTDDPTVYFCPSCHLIECRVCNKTVDGGIDEEERSRQVEEHLTVCATLRAPKAAVEAALEGGQTMPCPVCGLRGIKDESCMHMKCPRCETPWCYLCGLSVKDCDKAPARPGRPVDDIFLHNADWQTNEKRCPMYLTQILDIDPSWMGEYDEDSMGEGEVDDQRCLEYFHRWQTIRLLQSARTEIGEAAFDQVWERFDSVSNSGFTLQDIMFTDTSKMIDRDGWDEDEEDNYDPDDDHDAD